MLKAVSTLDQERLKNSRVSIKEEKEEEENDLC
jgi:hypothetical protein